MSRVAVLRADEEQKRTVFFEGRALSPVLFSVLSDLIFRIILFVWVGRVFWGQFKRWTNWGKNKLSYKKYSLVYIEILGKTLQISKFKLRQQMSIAPPIHTLPDSILRLHPIPEAPSCLYLSPAAVPPWSRVWWRTVSFSICGTETVVVPADVMMPVEPRSRRPACPAALRRSHCSCWMEGGFPRPFIS